MSSIYIVTELAYSEANDTIEAEFYLASQNGEEQDRQAFVYRVRHAYGKSSQISYHGKEHLECDPLFMPQLQLAFLEAFAEAHYDQNPGDSPAYTRLESFTTSI